jgi:hypothetical protein
MLNNFNMAAPSVYTPTARFDGSARALTEDELFRIAPSVFAIDKHESRTDRFKPIPTIDVIRALDKEGFSVVGAMQSKCRDEGKRPFTKHLLRLRNLEKSRDLRVNDSVFEIYLRNANDGTSSYEHLSGLFRIACANSLVRMQQEMERSRIRHTGDVVNKIIETTYQVLDTAQQCLAAPQDWGQIKLNRDEARILANTAHTIRFGEGEDGKLLDNGIKPETLLVPRRAEDTEPNLWSIFNVAQENAIRGGLHGVAYDANHRLRRRTTREIRGIDQNVNVNRALWRMAEEMAKLKQAA